MFTVGVSFSEYRPTRIIELSPGSVRVMALNASEGRVTLRSWWGINCIDGREECGGGGGLFALNWEDGSIMRPEYGCVIASILPAALEFVDDLLLSMMRVVL